MNTEQISYIRYLIIVFLLLSGCTTVNKQDEEFDNVSVHKVKEIDEVQEVSYENKMRANYNQVYYYPFDSSALSEEDIKSIKIQADYLNQHIDSKVSIYGHTDSRGSAEYNMGLGERRALSVVDLLKQYGVSKSQIKFNSFGEEKPAVLGETEAAYKWNRRTELVYGDF
ncbi:MAG: OmpA family protein [Legionellales bacterium]|nr:OmpA family protein [Legionellales bacterium]